MHLPSNYPFRFSAIFPIQWTALQHHHHPPVALAVANSMCSEYNPAQGSTLFASFLLPQPPFTLPVLRNSFPVAGESQNPCSRSGRMQCGSGSGPSSSQVCHVMSHNMNTRIFVPQSTCPPIHVPSSSFVRCCCCWSAASSGPAYNSHTTGLIINFTHSLHHHIGRVQPSNRRDGTGRCSAEG